MYICNNNKWCLCNKNVDAKFIAHYALLGINQTALYNVPLIGILVWWKYVQINITVNVYILIFFFFFYLISKNISKNSTAFINQWTLYGALCSNLSWLEAPAHVSVLNNGYFFKLLMLLTMKCVQQFLYWLFISDIQLCRGGFDPMILLNLYHIVCLSKAWIWVSFSIWHGGFF